MAKAQSQQNAISVADAAEDMKVTYMSVMRWIWKGAFPAFKDKDSKWYVTKKDLESFKNAHRSPDGKYSVETGKRGPKSGPTAKKNLHLKDEVQKKLALISIEKNVSIEDLIEDLVDAEYARFIAGLSGKKTTSKRS